MSNGFDFDRVREIFHEALDRDPDERAELLRERCGDDVRLRTEVETLLRFYAETDGPQTMHPEVALRFEEPGEKAGERIGRYKLLEAIGSGGFGTVWMAEQEEPVRRKVALKVIKLGMDTKQVVARFEAERQALALMDHPNIAKVLDGGATRAGRPYFVMELVRGVPITAYCQQARLPTRQRLELFRKVCHAIQHAHQKGVIHRDIKPSNILVTQIDGEAHPKVIDFGIAKATERRLTERTLFTEFRQMVGTPEYMAPEQAEMVGVDVDTRADVYSLGVLLYELLTGTKPFEIKSLLQRGYDEILRTIREVDPPRPSNRLSTLGERLPEIAAYQQTQPRSLGKLVHGELDWIVMKALEKDRARRYSTAQDFAADVERFLLDEAVQASAPGRFYRLRKFVSRHKLGAASVLLLAVLLISSMLVSLFLARQAHAERDRALQQALMAQEMQVRMLEANRDAEVAEDKAAHVSGFLTDLFASADPYPQKEVAVREVLDAAASRLPVEFGDQPLVEARVRQTVGKAYGALGLHAEGLAHLERSLEIQRRQLGENDWRILEIQAELAAGCAADGQLRRSRELWEATLENARAHPGSDSRAQLRWQILRAETESSLGYKERARQLLLQLAVDHAALLDGDSDLRCQWVASLGRVHLDLVELAEAEACLEEALRYAAEGHADNAEARALVLAEARLDWAQLLDARGNRIEARQIWEDLAHGFMDAPLGRRRIAWRAQLALAQSHSEEGQWQAAESLFAPLVLQREVAESSIGADVFAAYASCLMALDRWEEAEAFFLQAAGLLSEFVSHRLILEKIKNFYEDWNELSPDPAKEQQIWRFRTRSGR
jgi:serine/threonine protein kinase